MNPASPTDHPRADEAVTWLLDLDTADDHARFSRELESDAALLRLTGELRELLALVSLDPAQHDAPAHLRQSILDAATGRPQASSAHRLIAKPSQPARRTPLAWAASLMLAGGCLWLVLERATFAERIAQLEAQTTELVGQLKEARNAEHLAHVQIDTLEATLEEYRQGVAVVVWDETTQEGILKLDKMPPLSAEKDYQLWVVDPSHKHPVNAGIVRVNDTGFARVQFKPDARVQRAEKFALSVEKRGGVPVGEGPVVFVGP